MKEQRIVVEIDGDGRITADADGFTGGACLKDLERLLEDLGAGTATVERKPEDKEAQVTRKNTQTTGRQ